MTSGLVLIDKPQGWTSHDVVARLRKIAGTRRVGHAGTLDPMATGLLLVGVNSATKLLTFLVGEGKTYTATIRLGASTITDDAESDYLKKAEPSKIESLSITIIEHALGNLRGQINQVPSSVSAIKVNGERAYAKVRAGENVSLPSRQVTISKFQILGEPRIVTVEDQKFLDLDVVVVCSSGTYIRALARDLGASLGVGGHLTVLRRTQIGSYDIESAQTLETLTAENLRVLDISLAARQQFHCRNLNPQEVIDLRHGKRIRSVVKEKEADEPIAALDENGLLVAMLKKTGDELRSLVIFNHGGSDD